MRIERILVPTDFTSTADKAVEQAIVVARATGAAIDLLHIADDRTATRLRDAGLPADGLTAAMTAKAAAVRLETGIECGHIVREGSIFTSIAEVASEGGHQLMVAGTHGVQGIRQHLFGADMLRILRQLPIGALVIQQGGEVSHGMGRLVLPVGSHAAYLNLVHITAALAKAFGAEVIIYSVDRPTLPMSEGMMANTRAAIEHFKAEGVACRTVNEKPTVFSVGFAKQTLQFAANEKADAICIMSVSSEEHAFLAEPDKERIINNESGIPVLCGPGIEAWTNMVPRS